MTPTARIESIGYFRPICEDGFSDQAQKRVFGQQIARIWPFFIKNCVIQ